MSKKHIIGILTALFTFSAQAEDLSVTASFSILGDVAREIGGERVAVHEIISADKDAHIYRLTPQDLNTIRQSKLVLINGLGFESAEFERAIKSAKIPVAAATKNIKAMENDEHDEHNHAHNHEHHGHDHGEFDPHVWQDPVLMQTYAQNVAEALSKADPAGKEYYAQRLKNYSGCLKALHDYAQQQFSAIPEKRRKVLTSNEAFSYLGERYDIDFIAPQGVSEESEPSAKDVAKIIREVKEENIRAIFMENISNPKLVEQITRETGVKLSGKLYSDALSSADGEAPTYLKMMRYNIDALIKAMK